MSFEKLELNTPNKETSKRLLFAVELNIKPLIGKINVSGLEHLREIKKNEKIVIATTHLSDLDIPLVIKSLGENFDLAVSDLASNHNFFKDPVANVGIRIAGEENFLPLDTSFNPDNFTPMTEALTHGKEMVMAAHNPSLDGKLAKAGVGAVYLSQLADATILPVAVNIKSDQPFLAGKNLLKSLKEKPDVSVIIGSPYKNGSIEGIENIKKIMDKRRNKEKLSKNEIDEFSRLVELLTNQAEELMKKLAGMVPENKRGQYE